jgi:peptidoglycan/LPS O-acetylase OafA/YrhL
MSNPHLTERRSNCFDVLRLFAAVCVVIQHSVRHIHTPFLWVIPGRERFWFYDGVALFFILSGMLVYRSCEKCIQTGRPIRHFYINRFLRVAPAIYVYAVLSTALLLVVGVITLSTLKTGSYVGWFASNLALVPVYHPAAFKTFGVGVLNGSLWTIPTEVSFYLVVPLLFLFEGRFGFRSLIAWLAPLSIAGLAAEWWFQSHAPENMAAKLLHVSLAPHLFFFGLGIFWLRMWDRVPHRADLALTCAALYCLIRWNMLGIGWGPLWKAAWGIPLSYAVVWFAHHGPRQVNRVTRIGDLSYGVYIWHMVVVNMVLYYALPKRLVGIPGTSVHVLVLLITLVLALASWWLIEKPSLRLKPFTARGAAEELPPAAVAWDRGAAGRSGVSGPLLGQRPGR